MSRRLQTAGGGGDKTAIKTRGREKHESQIQKKKIKTETELKG